VRMSRSTESSRTRRGVEGFSRGGWVGRIGGQGRDEAAKVALDEALGAKAFLLGRRSYEFLAARWPSRSGPFADRLNSFSLAHLPSNGRAPSPLALWPEKT